MSRPPTHHTLASLKAMAIEEGDCWIWQGYLGNGVPGVYRKLPGTKRGTVVSARGWALELATGIPMKPGYYYRPTCGSPTCINPDHAVAASHKQHMSHMAKALNSQPAIAAIRAAKIGNTRRVLTSEQIQIILSDPRPSPAVAADLGISSSTVCRYRSGTLGRLRGPFGMMVATL